MRVMNIVYMSHTVEDKKQTFSSIERLCLKHTPCRLHSTVKPQKNGWRTVKETVLQLTFHRSIEW